MRFDPFNLMLMAVFLLVAMCIAPVSEVARADGAPHVSMTLAVGADGYVKADRPVPVTVNLANDGGDVAGQLVASDVSSTGTIRSASLATAFRTAYVEDVILPQGSHKQYAMLLPAAIYGRPIEVTFELDGERIASATAPTKVLGDQSMVVGIVSDDQTDLPDLRRIVLPRLGAPPVRSIAVAALTSQDLPSSVEPLQLYDALIMLHVTDRPITQQQAAALDAWVSGGGVLVLGGGPTWRGVTTELPQALLPVGQASTQSLGDLSSLAAFADTSTSPQGPAVVAAVSKPAGSVLAAAGGLPLIVARSHGAGSVVFLALDPADRSLNSWSGAPDFWRRLLVLSLPPQALLAPPASQQAGNYPDLGMEVVLAGIPLVSPPTLPVVGVLLVLYVLLTGPVGYILLRRFRRRGLAWATIPLLALGFTTVLYGIAFQTRGGDVVVNAISVNERSVGSELERDTSYVGLFAPSQHDYHAQLSPSAVLFGLSGPPYRTYPVQGTGAETPETPLGLTIHEGPRSVIELPRMPQWTMRSVRAEQWSPRSPSLVSQLRLESDGIHGPITNVGAETLVDGVIMSPWGAVRLGSLAPGEHRDVHIPTGELTSAFPPSYIYAAAFPSGSLSPSDARVARLHQQVLNALWPSWSGNGGAAEVLGPVYFLGWTQPSDSPLTIDGRRAFASGLELRAVGLPIAPDPAPSVPPGLLPVRLWSASGSVQNQGSSIALSRGDVTFAVVLPQTSPGPRSVDLTAAILGSVSSNGLSASVFNRRTDGYDPLIVGTSSVSSMLSAPLPSRAIKTAQGGGGASSPEAMSPSIIGITSLIPSGGTNTYVRVTTGSGDLAPYVAPDGVVLMKLERNTAGTLLLSNVAIGCGD